MFLCRGAQNRRWEKTPARGIGMKYNYLKKLLNILWAFTPARGRIWHSGFEHFPKKRPSRYTQQGSGLGSVVPCLAEGFGN